MDAVKLIKDDHKKVKELFRTFENARSADRKMAIAQEVFQELDVHAEIEEEIFYPAAKAKADKQMLISELKAMREVNEQFEAKFTVLIENVEHHIEEEEKEMLPDAQKTLGDDIKALGEQMMARKEELTATAR
jgi:hemerythrin-like domain-containing protein